MTTILFQIPTLAFLKKIPLIRYTRFLNVKDKLEFLIGINFIIRLYYNNLKFMLLEAADANKKLTKLFLCHPIYLFKFNLIKEIFALADLSHHHCILL